MSLSEIMSAAQLSVWPTCAMVIFAGVFTLLAVRLARTPRRTLDETARLPLEAD